MPEVDAGTIILWGGRILALMGGVFVVCVLLAGLYLRPLLPPKDPE